MSDYDRRKCVRPGVLASCRVVCGQAPSCISRGEAATNRLAAATIVLTDLSSERRQCGVAQLQLLIAMSERIQSSIVYAPDPWEEMRSVRVRAGPRSSTNGCSYRGDSCCGELCWSESLGRAVAVSIRSSSGVADGASAQSVDCIFASPAISGYSTATGRDFPRVSRWAL